MFGLKTDDARRIGGGDIIILYEYILYGAAVIKYNITYNWKIIKNLPKSHIALLHYIIGSV